MRKWLFLESKPRCRPWYSEWLHRQSCSAYPLWWYCHPKRWTSDWLRQHLYLLRSMQWLCNNMFRLSNHQSWHMHPDCGHCRFLHSVLLSFRLPTCCCCHKRQPSRSSSWKMRKWLFLESKPHCRPWYSEWSRRQSCSAYPLWWYCHPKRWTSDWPRHNSYGLHSLLIPYNNMYQQTIRQTLHKGLFLKHHRILHLAQSFFP